MEKQESLTDIHIQNIQHVICGLKPDLTLRPRSLGTEAKLIPQEECEKRSSKELNQELTPLVADFLLSLGRRII